MRNQKIEPDAAAKNYMGINAIFADVVNTAVYAGKNVVTPEKLENAETEVTALVYEGVDSSVTIKRLRDNRKFFTNVKGNKLSFVIYGIENQFYLHNAMPVKNMLYDILEYVSQIDAKRKKLNEYRKSGKPKKKLKEGEFLSAWSPQDKLVPAITVVVNFSGKKWSGPTSLHEMFSYKYPEASELIRKYIPDYKIIILDPYAMPEEEIKKMQSELKEVFQFIRASKSNRKTRKLLETEPKYRSMSSDAVVLLNACTGLSIKAEENEEGVVDMCKAFVDERKAGKREGILELLSNYMKNKNVSLETAMKDHGIPLEEKEKYLRYFKEENNK